MSIVGSFFNSIYAFLSSFWNLLFGRRNKQVTSSPENEECDKTESHKSETTTSTVTDSGESVTKTEVKEVTIKSSHTSTVGGTGHVDEAFARKTTDTKPSTTTSILTPKLDSTAPSNTTAKTGSTGFKEITVRRRSLGPISSVTASESTSGVTAVTASNGQKEFIIRRRSVEPTLLGQATQNRLKELERVSSSTDRTAETTGAGESGKTTTTTTTKIIRASTRIGGGHSTIAEDVGSHTSIDGQKVEGKVETMATIGEHTDSNTSVDGGVVTKTTITKRTFERTSKRDGVQTHSDGDGVTNSEVIIGGGIQTESSIGPTVVKEVVKETSLFTLEKKGDDVTNDHVKSSTDDGQE